MNNTYNVTGTIHAIGNEVPAGQKTKREIVLRLGDKWPQFVPFEAFGDRVELCEGLEEGDEVTIGFELRGREYNGANGVRYFGSNGIRSIQAREKAAPPPAVTKRAKPAPVDDEIGF